MPVGALRDVRLLEVGEEVELERLVLPARLRLGLCDRLHAERELRRASGACVLRASRGLPRERAREAEVVVKARVDRRADAEFGLGHEVTIASASTWAAEWRMRKALLLREGGEVNVGFDRFRHVRASGSCRTAAAVRGVQGRRRARPSRAEQ